MKFLNKLRSLRKGKTQKKSEQTSSQQKDVYMGGACITFRVDADGTDDVRGVPLSGVYKVGLPSLNRDYTPTIERLSGELRSTTTLRLDFDCPGNAAVLLKEPKKKHRIEVRAAVELWNAENGSLDIHAYQYIMDAELVCVQQKELENVKPMTTSVYFHVSRWKLIVDGEVLWEI